MGGVVLLTVSVLLVADLLQPPSRQLSNRVLIGCVDGYRAVLSPVVAAAGFRCRLTPSCSRYSRAAFEELGAVGGLWWTVRRLLRCGPWTPQGTIDPPPRRHRDCHSTPLTIPSAPGSG